MSLEVIPLTCQKLQLFCRTVSEIENFKRIPCQQLLQKKKVNVIAI